ncbi:MAG: PLP-dependent aminotransferase family protein [Pseudomonadota bacterium]
MTNWLPDLQSQSGPRYKAIVACLAKDVAAGRLSPGTRLPTHRDLAWQLGVTVGTITRAYAEAEKRGLVLGEVGRGTFVRAAVPNAPPVPRRDPGGADLIDLSYNFPPHSPENHVISEALGELSAEGGLPHLLDYQLGLGHPHHRAAGVAWLEQFGLEAEADQLAVTAGAQHAMLLATAAATRPGDILLAEELTFYGIKTIASLLDLRLYGLTMDEEGLTPEGLDAACRSSGAKALYCIPSLQNPTTAIMSEERRQAVAEVCRRHGVTVIEDDVYGFLPEPGPAPLTNRLPEQGIYLTSLSKCVAPGLRIGFLKAPAAKLERITTAMRASTLMAPPVMAEVAARLIADGRAKRLTQWQRGEAQARQALARRYLPAEGLSTQPDAFHLWLELPEPWRREDFTAAARRRGVGLASAEVFAVGRQPVPHAVRICLQAAQSRAHLEQALDILGDLLRTPEATRAPIV